MIKKLKNYTFMLAGCISINLPCAVFAAAKEVKQTIVADTSQSPSSDSHRGLSTAEKTLFTRLAKLKNMYAKFRQTLVNPEQEFREISTGELWMSKPSFFKWQILVPQKQMLLSNGQKLWNYDEELEQVTVSDVPKNISQAPYLLLLTGDSKVLSQLFSIDELSSHRYRLTPKVEDQSLIKYIDMDFVNDTPSAMLIQTEVGQSTQIEFYNTSTKPIPADTYQFTPPDGVDVLGS
ncbi:outer membrane lipoprotein chaperone LolA [Caedibacter taeniospiralis]|uniref:outer membrane lipoprotein chaperone LolA n=1 Tax=Caedibacter taeniospiralis TaxID=28907 RepID=UPI000C27E33C|nr:outer membrane lipoprotein chaperone LolA [Caedibacter taeniospiralis]